MDPLCELNWTFWYFGILYRMDIIIRDESLYCTIVQCEDFSREEKKLYYTENKFFYQWKELLIIYME